MRKFNVRLTSPETDGKIARPASIIFMIVAWLFFAICLTFIVIVSRQPDAGSWDAMGFIIVGGFVLGLVLIPIQLVRYFRSR